MRALRIEEMMQKRISASAMQDVSLFLCSERPASYHRKFGEDRERSGRGDC